MKADVKDLNLADQGRTLIEWADRQMPVMRVIRDRFAVEKPLAGLRIAAGLHITPETAVLMQTLQAGGAELALCASNPLSTRDEICASLVVHDGVSVYALYRETVETYYRHVDLVIAHRPHILMDDGADLIARQPGGNIIGGLEETTTGVLRVRAMEREGQLRFPVIAVNDSPTKRFFDNRYGTGQNTIDGILRATNILIAGKTAVVAGYGWVGRGIASRLRGMGANVIVTEISPHSAIEALMDGYRVLPITEAIREADLIITATGNTQVVSDEHFPNLKDGALLCNSGHFDVEINTKALRQFAVSRKAVRPNTEEYLLPTGQRVYLIAEGRLVGQAAAEASPASVMDMSFANQALATEWLVMHRETLRPIVYDVPPEIDEQIARLKLDALGVRIDSPSPAQMAYANAWNEGT
jgi:adenosylhomocysteinase